MMGIQIPVSMKESLSSLPFSNRLRKSLLNTWGSEYPFEEVIAEYRKDPEDFESFFLRQPGAGRVQLNELIDFLDGVGDGNDYTGRIVAITCDEAEQSRKAIAEACHYISADSPLYSQLRDLENWLRAGTLHIEQENDARRMFQP